MADTQEIIDIAIIGGGPAGVSAAIYAARAGFVPVIFEKTFVGGQIAQTSEVENYPGLGKIGAFELIQAFSAHLKLFPHRVVNAEIISVELNGDLKLLRTKDKEHAARRVILAAGAKPRKLGVPGEAEFAGRGVSSCAVCDGAFYRGKTVAVVGGGETALHDAAYLSRLCEKVYLIHRRREFRGNSVCGAPNIAITTPFLPLEISGGEAVESIKLKHAETGETAELPVSCVFVAVGTEPATRFLRGSLAMTENGQLLTNERMETEVSGVYAAGDARKTPLRQIVTAAADGAAAGSFAASSLK
ncbi:MAG: FAD-dependent oxidoreductase [Clostridiales bacterium]|nr:FAD-dependent oxidoreductase [Clostridiales bacterium]